MALVHRGAFVTASSTDAGRLQRIAEAAGKSSNKEYAEIVIYSYSMPLDNRLRQCKMSQIPQLVTFVHAAMEYQPCGAR
jgi:hypothetical protein